MIGGADMELARSYARSAEPTGPWFEARPQVMLGSGNVMGLTYTSNETSAPSSSYTASNLVGVSQ